MMRVFISWSGELSKKLATAISKWLPRVIQAVKPSFTPNTSKGNRWLAELTDALSESKIGIIVLTCENMDSRWINFEAGALSNRFIDSRVCPVLFAMKARDISGPLSQFQVTEFEKDDFRKVLKSINEALEDHALDDNLLETVYEKWWPELDRDVQGILSESQVTSGEDGEERIDIDNVLRAFSSISSIVSSVENRQKTLAP